MVTKRRRRPSRGESRARRTSSGLALAPRLDPRPHRRHPTPLGLSRFYFRGDTQIAYLGWWYHLGDEVRAGRIPLMEPLAWEAGNYVAEGQWGLFSR